MGVALGVKAGVRVGVGVRAGVGGEGGVGGGGGRGGGVGGDGEGGMGKGSGGGKRIGERKSGLECRCSVHQKKQRLGPNYAKAQISNHRYHRNFVYDISRNFCHNSSITSKYKTAPPCDGLSGALTTV